MKLATLFVVSLALSLLGGSLTGCMMDDDDTGVVAEPLVTQNAYTFNAYTFNAYTFNAYTFNGYSASNNALHDLAHHTFDKKHIPDAFLRALDDYTPISNAGKYTTVSAYVAATLEYAYSCAMEQGTTLTLYSPNGNKLILEGSLGLSPGWGVLPDESEPGFEHDVCNKQCQQWVSACMISRINAFGVHVPISLAGENNHVTRDATEKASYDFQEGAFWGNLLGGVPHLYACSGKDWTSDKVKTSDPRDPTTFLPSYIQERVCGRGGSDDCHITYLGACDEVLADSSKRCDETSDGVYGPCLGANGVTSDQIITSFLDPDTLLKVIKGFHTPAPPAVHLAYTGCFRGSNSLLLSVGPGDTTPVAYYQKQYKIGYGAWNTTTSTSVHAPSRATVRARARACSDDSCSDWTVSAPVYTPYCASGGIGGGGGFAF